MSSKERAGEKRAPFMKPRQRAVELVFPLYAWGDKMLSPAEFFLFAQVLLKDFVQPEVKIILKEYGLTKTGESVPALEPRKAQLVL